MSTRSVWLVHAVYPQRHPSLTLPVEGRGRKIQVRPALYSIPSGSLPLEGRAGEGGCSGVESATSSA
jgi:hypothetical protein